MMCFTSFPKIIVVNQQVFFSSLLNEKKTKRLGEVEEEEREREKKKKEDLPSFLLQPILFNEVVKM